MASLPPAPPPGTGAFRPEEDERFEPQDHLAGWNRAIDRALANFGRAPGRYTAELVLWATIEVRNPGSVVEYFATFK
jgi:hypothetical protein